MSNVPRNLRDSAGFVGHNRLQNWYKNRGKEPEEETRLWADVKSNGKRADAHMVGQSPRFA